MTNDHKNERHGQSRGFASRLLGKALDERGSKKDVFSFHKRSIFGSSERPAEKKDEKVVVAAK